MTDGRWFAPHDAYHGNAEAGPSAQLPPPIPHGTRPTAQPIGGTPETTADAETNKPITEEDETPVSDFYYSLIPHITDRLSGIRHPGPCVPAAKGWHVPTANETAGTYSNCGHGRKLYEGAGGSLATEMQ